MNISCNDHGIRHDLGMIFLAWLALANLIWLATPWGQPLSELVGPAWLWAGLIPGTLLAALYPRQSARALFFLLAVPLIALRRADQRRDAARR